MKARLFNPSKEEHSTVNLQGSEEKHSDNKQKVTLLCNICSDGLGDLTHLLDIYVALSKRYPNHEFIPVITGDGDRKELFAKQLRALNVPEFYIIDTTVGKALSNDPKLAQLLKETTQLFCISNEGLGLRSFENYVNPKALRKYIGEHDVDIGIDFRRRWGDYSLGLTKFGLKLKKEDGLPLEQALANMQGQDSLFVDALLKHTQAPNIKQFSENHSLIPAYFNDNHPLEKFISLITSNKLARNPVFYCSGKIDPSKFKHLGKSPIQKIICIKPDNQVQTITCNPEGGQTIYIMSGFNLTDRSYKALYQQEELEFVGVSGDNTFEMALSNGKIPFYYPTHFNTPMIEKRRYLGKLEQIIQECNLSSSAKKTCMTYFNNIVESQIPFDQINFQELLKSWPVVIAKLFERYNFYDKLEDIFETNPNLDAHLEMHAKAGNINAVREFFNKFPNLIKSTAWEIAFCTAMDNGHSNIVEFLLSLPDIKIEGYNEYYFPLLNSVLKSKNIQVLAKLLEYDQVKAKIIDLSYSSTYWKDIPLFRTIEENNTEAALMLLKIDKININQDMVEEPYGFSSSMRITPLYLAVRSGNIDICKRLLELGAKVPDETNTKKKSPLYEAIYNKHLAMVELLYDKCDMNVRYNDKFPLEAAIAAKDYEIFKLLLNKTEINPDNGSAFLMQSMKNTNMLELLLKTKPMIIEYINKESSTMICHVFSTTNIGIENCKKFCQITGFNQYENKIKITPLQYAIFLGNGEAVRHLVSAGAEVNQTLQIGTKQMNCFELATSFGGFEPKDLAEIAQLLELPKSSITLHT